jgi:hypothetical protein
MHDDLFDQLTRAFATATSRRDAVKILAAAGASLLVVGTSGCRMGAAAQDGCTTASSCGDRRYCSEDHTCMCMEVTEGHLRCARIPDPNDCDLFQTCTSSDECKILGDEFFCTRGTSGCCPETHGYCLPPCNAQNVQDMARSGTWTGGSRLEAESHPLRVVLTDEKGHLSGELFVGDPLTREWIPIGMLTGTRLWNRASLRTQGDLHFDGTFAGDHFTGTLAFPRFGDAPAFTATIHLQRED